VAINHLNPQNIIHINPGKESSVKLIDFEAMGADLQIGDLDAFLGEAKRELACYCAPEIIHGNWTIKNDEFAVGVIMYFMLTGNPPFWSENYRDTLKQIINYKFDQTSERWTNLSAEARDLILRLMAFRPEDRFSAQQALNHAWFKKASRGELDQKEIGEALHALKDFHTGSKLKQAVHSFFIQNLLS